MRMGVTIKRLLGYICIAAILLVTSNILLVSYSKNQADEKKASELLNQINHLRLENKHHSVSAAELQQEIYSVRDKLAAAAAAEARKRQNEKEDAKLPNDGAGEGLVLPILVFSCNRAEAIGKALDDLIKYRPSKEKFPIIVTQDCGHQPTSDKIQSYSQHIHKHIKQPDLSSIPNLSKKDKKFEGYFKISRHYRWALTQIFDEMRFKVVIIMEDDLNISPDFYEYFEATYHLLVEDPTLYCVSAWNDNGKAKNIEDNSELLYRSDFFPGLGWMMLDTLWDEYRQTWPVGFWDDWLRQEPQRKGRSCIRPEISRTHTFGEKGVSLGMFYKKHLKFIVLNERKIEWTKKDLSYLMKDAYDKIFMEAVNNSPLVNLNQVETVAREKRHSSVRITYRDKKNFKDIAKILDIMDDFKDGIPRTAYLGILTIFHNGIRIYLTPPEGWQKYDRTWT